MSPTPLLLVPGLMCDHTVWEPLLPMLSQHAQAHIVEHGDANSLTRMAERLLAQAPEKFALAGHSMGGRVALEVLRLAPQRVLRVALLDTGYLARLAGTAGEEEARKRQDLLEMARARGIRAMAQIWAQGMVHPVRLDDVKLIGDILDMFERKTVDIFAHQILALLDRPDATPVLQRINVPTLVLCGREDSWAPVSQHEKIAALIPDGYAMLRIIEQCGHMSTMEQPEAAAEALCHWLATPSQQTA